MAKEKRGRRREARAELVPVADTLDAIKPPSAEAAKWEKFGVELERRLAGWRQRVPARFWTLPRWSRWAVGSAAALVIALPINVLLGYRGQVTSSNAAVRGYVTEIGTRIDGLVASVTADVGDRVSASQVLVQLDDRTLRAQVEEARAEVAALEGTIASERTAAELESAQIQRQRGESEAQIAAARANAEAWRIEAAEAVRNHELQTQLAARGGFVAAEALRAAESAARTARARLQEAEANATAIERSTDGRTRGARDGVTIRVSRIAVLEADLRAAQARLAAAEADLESAAIRAPTDGAIVRRIVQPGSAIEAGQPVISMWLGDDLWVESWIDEEELGSVRVGSEATVTFHALPGQEFSGTVERIGLATDLEIPEEEVPQPRFSRMRGAPVVGVRIRLDDQPSNLMPGLSAVVAIRREG
jgi:multidrug resistance efflux pump